MAVLPATVVIGGGATLPAGIAVGLAERGYPVALLGNSEAAVPGVVAVDVAELGDVDVLRAGISQAASAIGPIGAAVLAHVPAMACHRSDLVDLDEADWDERCESVLRRSVAGAQAVYGELRDGGAIVMTVPTIALGGAAGFAAYAAAAEGQHGLAKSLARQWGRRGIRVNCVALSTEVFGGDLGLVRRRELHFPARSLDGHGDVAHDIAPVVGFLIGEESHYVNGATICADGGAWMPS